MRQQGERGEEIGAQGVGAGKSAGGGLISEGAGAGLPGTGQVVPREELESAEK